jgi:hypothetical protein
VNRRLPFFVLAGLLAAQPMAALLAQEPLPDEPGDGGDMFDPAAGDPTAAADDGFQLDFGFEAKAHFRQSDDNRFPVAFPFSPEMLPPGETQGFEETVNEGSHLELSTVTLFVDAAWGDGVAAHAKIDVIDLYDRNPTSGDRQFDVDEAWVRFGRETPPAFLADGTGAYLKVGKMPKLERQDDRHLESYGLVSTAFNRFEDLGVEVGLDVGSHVYFKATATQGNPLFIRDPNALAGDNGTDDLRQPNPDPALKSGIVILYDAEVEDLDTDGETELGAAAGVRFGDLAGTWGVDLMAFGYQRDLADTVELEGTFYGGDLDLLRGPLNLFPVQGLDGREKTETGANLWLYAGGFSAFGQYVAQELAGVDRTGAELELAWQIELPLVWAVGGRQLFPFIQPAVRYSRLENDFATHPLSPAPSIGWDWDKIDVGVRLGVLPGIDLTLEYAQNDFERAVGDGSNDEALVTLRWSR